ncbi:hypothetical protein [Pseudomonas asiatica]|uniref:hypothetical protein n=1 Tax=Pseudomonas asiatica TaxID=2219225 RepID=UPI0010BFBF66|nr:hypothetical protein [Pseudomonas asiatica]
MTTNSPNASMDQTLLGRSKKWLASEPTLQQIKAALSAMIAKVAKGELPDNADFRSTADELIQCYVDREGDLADLPQIPEAISQEQSSITVPTPVAPAEFDCGSLHPDGEPAAPLSLEEKRRRLLIIKSSLVRPGGF